MRFMVLVHSGNNKANEAGYVPTKEELAPMGKFNEELVKAGVMLAADGLHSSAKGAKVHFPGKGKELVVTHGPFEDTRNMVDGFWIWQVRSKEEALEWAKKAPMEDGATLELRQIVEFEDFNK